MEKARDFEGKSGSFHGKLLDRGQTCLPVRKRDRLAKLAKRTTWVGVPTRFSRFVAASIFFAGGLAIGAGIVLLKRGDSAPYRPQLYIGVGLACILLSIIARLFPRSESTRLPHATRG